jgi:hypothetical protein
VIIRPYIEGEARGRMQAMEQKSAFSDPRVYF